MAIRLTTQTLANMRGNTPLFVSIVKENELNTVETVRRWMRQNKLNGPLTSIANLALISNALNVPIKYLTESLTDETNRKRKPDPYPAITGQDG